MQPPAPPLDECFQFTFFNEREHKLILIFCIFRDQGQVLVGIAGVQKIKLSSGSLHHYSGTKDSTASFSREKVDLFNEDFARVDFVVDVWVTPGLVSFISLSFSPPLLQLS